MGCENLKDESRLKGKFRQTEAWKFSVSCGLRISGTRIEKYFPKHYWGLHTTYFLRIEDTYKTILYLNSLNEGKKSLHYRS
jgi:hypothetical protein